MWERLNIFPSLFTTKAGSETVDLPHDAFEVLIEILGEIGRAPFGEVGLVPLYIDEVPRGAGATG